MADQQQPQQEEMNAVHADSLDLPPGFRFHPSDVEIVSHYLRNKVCNMKFTYTTLEEVDLKNTEPWNLPIKAKWSDNEWYFFYQKDHKYATGLRVNRATKAGYWRATGKDKEVYNTIEGNVLLVGMKKTLVFYKGKPPRGNKTNWVMHEYRLEGSGSLPGPTSASTSSANTTTAMKASAAALKDEWVVCRVFENTNRIKKRTAPAYQVAMDGAEIDTNQNNILGIPIPVPPQLPLPVPLSMQFPLLPDFAMDPVPAYYRNTSAGMPPMVGIDGELQSNDAGGGLQIDDTLFNNMIASPPQMDFYHQIDMGATIAQMDMGAAIAQMDMGATSAGGFDVAMPESRLSSMVSQKDEQANTAEISSLMSMTGSGSATTTMEMDNIWNWSATTTMEMDSIWKY